MELEGLRLLLPLTESTDSEVQRLAAHALANLSVNGAPCRGVFMPQLCAYSATPLPFPPHVGLPKPDAHSRAICCDRALLPSVVENQVAMAQEGAIDMLVALLACESHKVQRQAAKALANLGVNGAWQL